MIVFSQTSQRQKPRSRHFLRSRNVCTKYAKKRLTSVTMRLGGETLTLLRSDDESCISADDFTASVVAGEFRSA